MSTPTTTFTATQIVKDLPRYDGKTPCTRWLDELDQKSTHYSTSPMFKLIHMDKILTDTAADWWTFNRDSLVTGIDAQNEAQRFTEFTKRIKSYFADSEDRDTAKSLNKARKFKLHEEDPREYITAKLALLFRIDPQMPEPKKIKKLLRGLPEDLERAMLNSLGTSATIESFTKELKYRVKYLKKKPRDASPAKSSTHSELYNPLHGTPQGQLSYYNPHWLTQSQLQQSQYPKPPPSEYQQPQFQPNPFQPAQYHQPMYNVPQQQYQPPPRPKTPPTVCGYCGNKGHAQVDCRRYRREAYEFDQLMKNSGQHPTPRRPSNNTSAPKPGNENALR